MAVVAFVPADFKLAFPEFADVPDARLTALFNMAGATIIDNSDASVIVDPAVRAPLMDLLVAHMLTLYGTTVVGSASGGPNGAVGRVSSATEGSVSTSMEYRAASSATESWFNQTQYGAMYWAMTSQWRSFRYAVVGRSGVGQSLDFLNPRALGYPGRTVL